MPINSDNPRLDKVREQFTRQAAAYARMRQACDEESFRKLVALSGAKPSDNVLDVACGPGFLTMIFAEHCASVTGFDATDQFLKLAKTEGEGRGLANLQFDHGNAEALPYTNNSFDLTLCRAAFHHMREPRFVLAEMQRVTKPGGHLLVVDMLTSTNKEQALYHNRIERLCDPSHVRALAETEFDALYTAANLFLVKRAKSAIHYASVAEWLDHGGPTPEAEREILALMEASLESDRSGLDVRREGGQLCFSHTVIADLVKVANRESP